MSFAKLKSQTLPDLVNMFTRQFNEFKYSYENDRNQELLHNIQAFDIQINRMELKLNDAPDNKKVEYTTLFQTVLSEYLKFKTKYKNEIKQCFDEQNLKASYTQDEKEKQYLVEQSMEEQEAQDLEYISRESEKIMRQMRELNEINNQVYQEINNQRAKIVSIEKITDTAVKKMEKGNQQLDEAEKNQKTCNIF